MLHTSKLTKAALFAALTAILSQIAIPTPWMIPMNFATLSVFLSGAVCGPRWGMISQLVYLAVGLCGLPVFSGFRGGMDVLFGPTGGYILGYVCAAWAVGFFLHLTPTKWMLPLSMGIGLFLCYALGTAWFLFSTQTSLRHALMLCVVPFLAGDGIKIGLGCLLVPRLSRYQVYPSS